MQSSHVMAMSVQRLFPGTKVTIGPWIVRGFYYDFDIPQAISQDDLKDIKKEMQRIIKKKLPFLREEARLLHTTTAHMPSIPWLTRGALFVKSCLTLHEILSADMSERCACGQLLRHSERQCSILKL